MRYCLDSETESDSISRLRGCLQLMGDSPTINNCTLDGTLREFLAEWQQLAYGFRVYFGRVVLVCFADHVWLFAALWTGAEYMILQLREAVRWAGWDFSPSCVEWMMNIDADRSREWEFSDTLLKAVNGPQGIMILGFWVVIGRNYGGLRFRVDWAWKTFHRFWGIWRHEGASRFQKCELRERLVLAGVVWAADSWNCTDSDYCRLRSTQWEMYKTVPRLKKFWTESDEIFRRRWARMLRQMREAAGARTWDSEAAVRRPACAGRFVRPLDGVFHPLLQFWGFMELEAGAAWGGQGHRRRFFEHCWEYPLGRFFRQHNRGWETVARLERVWIFWEVTWAAACVHPRSLCQCTE